MVTIQCGTITLHLNGAELTPEERVFIIQNLSQSKIIDDNGEHPYTSDEIQDVIDHEEKMRSIHSQIIALDELDLISEMVQANPNGWFVDYCNSRGIEI